MAPDLAAQLVVLRLPIHGVDRDEKGEHPRALDVAQELEAESLPRMRSLDDAGNVGHDEGPRVAHLHDAKIRCERRERIIGDLRARGRDHREERGLAGVRLADESDVGDQLQLEFKRLELAFLARLPFPRRLMRCGRKERVSLASAPALGDADLLSVVEHVRDPLARFAIADHRARRHWHDHVLPRAPRLVRPHPVLAALGFPVVAIREVEQRREVRVPAHDHVAPLAPIAAVGPTHRGELLTAERRATGAAGTGGHLHGNKIDEQTAEGRGERWEVRGPPRRKLTHHEGTLGSRAHHRFSAPRSPLCLCGGAVGALGYFPRTRARRSRPRSRPSALTTSARHSSVAFTSPSLAPALSEPCRCAWS